MRLSETVLSKASFCHNYDKLYFHLWETLVPVGGDMQLFFILSKSLNHAFSELVQNRAVQLIEFDYHAHLVSKAGSLISG